MSLEHHLEPELNHPRSSAAQAGIGLSDIGSLADQSLMAPSIRIALQVAILVVTRCQIVIGQREVRMIENVEKLRPKLQVNPFPHLCVLSDGEINISVAGSKNR